MKKFFCILLACVFCLSLFSCMKFNLEESIQGEWIKSVEAQSPNQVSVVFDNGTVKRTETTNGDNKRETRGTYELESESIIRITYSDGTVQGFRAYTTDNGITLTDMESGTYFTKKN